MANVGYATLTIIPSADGFLAALSSQLGTVLPTAGRKAGEALGKQTEQGFLDAIAGLAKAVAGVFALDAVKSFVASSLDAFGTFERYMNQVAAATGAPADAMDRLSKLALQLGADTSFSASQAAAAMLELAKGGLTPAQIEAGALATTMQLAAAGNLDLATAANTVVGVMGAFGLSAEQSAIAANALAGAANASSADVSDLTQALAQVAAQAVNSGMSVQETTGVLAAFADQGIRGSDAGTSLKTMLQRLVPYTKSARDTMEELGISFVNADGSFKSITEIAQILQDRLGGLTDAQRAQALQTIFGSDATRAATILMNEGAEGIQQYIDAANDQTAAQQMADASMQGWAGTVEKLSGAWESFKIAFGSFVAPAIEPVINGIASAIDFASQHMAIFGPLVTAAVAAVGLLGAALLAVGVKTAVMAALPAIMGAIRAATVAWTAVQWALNVALNANPIGLIVLAIAALIGIIIACIKYHEEIGAFFKKVWEGIKNVVSAVVDWFKGPFLDFFKNIGNKIVEGWNAFVSFFTETIPNAFNAVVNWFKELPGKIWDFIKSIPDLAREGLLLLAEAVGFGIGLLVGFMLTMPQKVWDIITGLWNKVVELTKAGWAWIVETVTSGVTAAIDWIASMPGKIWDLITNLWNRAVQIVTDGVNRVVEWHRDMVQRAIEFVTSLPGRIWSLLTDLWNRAVQIVTDGVNRVVDWFRQLPQRAWEFVSQLPGRVQEAVSGAIDWLWQAGRDVVQGLINGITSMWGRITGLASEMANKFKDGFKSALSIFSPSRVFAGYGRDIVRGLALGVNQSAEYAVKAVTGLARSVAASFTTGPGGIAGAIAAMGGGRTLNYYAAPGSGLSSEEELFAAASRARMVW